MIEFEMSRVKHLEQVMQEAPGLALDTAKAVVGKGALNIKRDAQSAVRGLAHAPAYPYSITYETRENKTEAVAEIGPDKERRQGALGNIIEYGTLNNPPRPHLRPAAERELPKFETALLDALQKQLEER